MFDEHSKSFIPFMMSGYPDFKTSTQALIELCMLGVDAIEVGVPYSDPIADGPVNQNAICISAYVLCERNYIGKSYHGNNDQIFL